MLRFAALTFAALLLSCRPNDTCIALNAINNGSPSPGLAGELADECTPIVQEGVCCPGRTEATPIKRSEACGRLIDDGSFTTCDVEKCSTQDPCAPDDGTCAGLNTALAASFGYDGSACSCNAAPEACPNGTFCNIVTGTCDDGCVDDVDCTDGEYCYLTELTCYPLGTCPDHNSHSGPDEDCYCNVGFAWCFPDDISNLSCCKL